MDYDPIPESLRKSMEISDKLRESVSPILEHQDRIQKIVDTASIPKIDTLSPRLEAISSAAKDALTISDIARPVLTGAGSGLPALQNSGMIHTLGEFGLESAFQPYRFDNPVLKAIEAWSSSAVENLASGLIALITSPVMQEIESIASNFGKWLQTVDFSPLINILENIRNIGFDYDYEEVKEVFLKAMFDARWFPYAGWIADPKIMDAMLEILETSRASKNRVKRIDKLIFTYYNKEEINNLKRGWRQMNLPSYMTRILVQSVQAYHRREYALTVSALSTLWEGIIQEKMNDDNYRISKRTRENLSKLIEENEFDKIFASFCEEFIFYDCRKAEDVKPDVPGRHGIAHCWYNTYPSRKMALNAILFTDFLLGLKPLEKMEEATDG